MAEKYTFNFEDGTNVEFEKLANINRHEYLYGGQPAKIPGQAAGTVGFYVAPEIYTWDRETRWDRTGLKVKTSKFAQNIQVGLLMQKAAVGLPIGSYVPIKWNNAMNRFDVFLTGLTNEKLIIDERVASIDTIDKVAKAEKAAEAEDSADNA